MRGFPPRHSTGCGHRPTGGSVRGTKCTEVHTYCSGLGSADTSTVTKFHNRSGLRRQQYFLFHWARMQVHLGLAGFLFPPLDTEEPFQNSVYSPIHFSVHFGNYRKGRYENVVVDR